MHTRAGIIGGVAGGLIMMILDQLALAMRISSVNTMGELSLLFFGSMQMNPIVWLIRILATGLVGWLVSKLMPKRNTDSYIASGILAGMIIWAAMNVMFTISGVITPTWSYGAGSFIVNLITHVVLGISITYTIWRYKVKAIAQIT